MSVVLAGLLGGVIIGTQFWLDHRLAEEAMEMVEKIDVEIDVLKGEANRLRALRAEASGDEAAALNSELRQTASRIVFKNIEAFNNARSVVDLRFIRAERSALQLTRDRLFLTIRAALDYGEPELAKALTDIVMQRQAEDEASMMSNTDMERLQALAAEAEEAITRATEPAASNRP